MKSFFKPQGYWTDEDSFFLIGMAAILFGFAAMIIMVFFPSMFDSLAFPCPIHVVTGLYCPGCGGTRAFRALIHADIIGSIIYNPVVLYFTTVGGVFVVSQSAKRLSRGRLWGMKFRYIYLWILLGLFLVNCLIKNVALLAFDIKIIE